MKNEQDSKSPEIPPLPPAACSAEYYLLQMLERLKEHGEYRVRWEWAIRHMTDWKVCAEELASPHYILEPELRSAKFRDALKGYENRTQTNDILPNDQAER